VNMWYRRVVYVNICCTDEKTRISLWFMQWTETLWSFLEGYRHNWTFYWTSLLRINWKTVFQTALSKEPCSDESRTIRKLSVELRCLRIKILEMGIFRSDGKRFKSLCIYNQKDPGMGKCSNTNQANKA
jgi:hypothetical protein